MKTTLSHYRVNFLFIGQCRLDIGKRKNHGTYLLCNDNINENENDFFL